MDKTAFNFNKWNTIIGWFTFGIALITYTLWRLNLPWVFLGLRKYIATAAKLRSWSSPGTFTNDWSLFCHVFRYTKIALMVNMVSVFSSAFTIYLCSGLHQWFWENWPSFASTTSLNSNNDVVILGVHL
jgi:hypothetical protein